MSAKNIFIISLCLILSPSIVFAGIIYGTVNDDLLCGSSIADWIYGYGGNDIIGAKGGNDLMYGGAGSDQCYGGSGNNVCSGCETCYLEGDYSECGSKSLSDDDKDCNTAIGCENLSLVVGGSDLDVVLFPIENYNVPSIKGSDVVEIFANDENVLDLIMSAVNYDTTKHLIKNESIIANGDGSYLIPLPALTNEEAANIAATLFSKSANGVAMENPYTGKSIAMENVDYVGFRNTPLIPINVK